MERKELWQIIFNFLLVVAICTLIFTTIKLIKNKDIIQNDPLNYGMKVHNFTTCSCQDVDGKTWFSKDGGFIHTEFNPNASTSSMEINWSEIKIK